ncbi:MAG: hypothetical protein C6P37_11165 [Caldibacillus debilis]|uniref:Uncharacterized protein n=1 Tax=Caldibacillus debilis TaxID=301148 RepID=A0A3E0K391_9BACI|nr:MAG: hypothetical protein C6W57_15330 [Caldibacillus debilis]REJ27654.1 MAG: hypothetical protein C6P37_11165 [Caldibacillus debilis]REJ30779.1 MAG: hypothetical protein C6W56_02215 [Caldibacillus debilis]
MFPPTAKKLIRLPGPLKVCASIACIKAVPSPDSLAWFWSGRAAFTKKPSVFPAPRGFPVKARGGETGCFPQHAGGTAYGPNGMSLAKREKAALDREASQGRTRVFGRDGRLGAGGVLTAGPRRSRFSFAALKFCEGLQVPFREGRK